MRVPGALDPDDLRTMIGQHHGRERGRRQAGQLKDANTVERLHEALPCPAAFIACTPAP
jgi:hypothetical protein